MGEGLAYNRLMSLKLAFVFHFDQLTSERVRVADRAAYRGLLDVLRAHPKLKFNLHFSGTLLRALGWLSPETLDLVRAGVADGQFDLLGGLHAQNVAYASDDRDNLLQLQVHARVLSEMLGVKPSVFWNPERTWRDSLLPLIAGAGYDTMLLEDRILRAAGVTAPTPVRFVANDAAVTTIWDDVPLRERFHWAIWYGRDGELWRYIEDAQERARSASHWMACAGDAEAIGLWGWEAGYLPQAHWSNLDKVLTQCESRELTLEHLSAARGKQAISSAPDTAAVSLDRAAVTPEAPRHEAGFENYFDFAERSPKLGYFRKLFAVVRASFAETASVLAPIESRKTDAPAASARFLQLAEEVYAAHQHGFGVIGVGGREYWAWENIRHTFLYLRLAQLAADPTPRRWIEDLNGDGNDEQMWCDGRQLAMFSGFGGRLLGWFDLQRGAVWVGNPLAMPRARYVDGASAHPKVIEESPRWLPEAAGIDLRAYKALREKEPAPPRLVGDVDPTGFAREPEGYWIYRRPAEPAEPLPPLHIHHAALNDWWSTDDGEQPAGTFIDYRFEDDGIAYVNAGVPDVVIHKNVALAPHGLTVSYRVQNRSTRKRTLGWRLTHELNPGYADVLAHGRAALDPIQAPEGIVGVVNRITDNAVTIACSRAWDSTAWSAGLLALEVEGALRLDLPARGALSWQVDLTAR